ncbi:polysaccharide pyruvyl transferase family protein [Dyadobacter sp. CY345]|uniref:polysaccharide pyruvyl transferase family protein n=1 Tax=Dyadobacter sp. CY345 TaxID=2909335 RepID=UPI001F2B039B|nr:polysaccharide pyruvyl transferase family protein [Dyadobacter sp. CY345]MCF2447047.1 polysaccharide pyruvyl transferase family protein [Dyadobacter sp. CY345]
MKIGILTLPLHTNYGGLLQAYALRKTLQDLGHEVWIIDREKNYHLPLSKLPIEYVKRFVKKYILRYPNQHIRKEKHEQKEYPLIAQHTDKFIEKYIGEREIVLSPNLIHPERFDAIVVGSDQIWRPKYYSNIQDAYLAFAENWNIKRISYAPSFGTEQWEYNSQQTDQFARLLKMFDSVSVRESSAVILCKEKFGVIAKHVADPTLLLNVADYVAIAKTHPKHNGNLLISLLDNTSDKQDLIDSIINLKGYVPFYINSKTEDKTATLADRIAPPVEGWVRGFYDADFVITDSFHAACFSIMFNKPFLVYGNAQRGLARFNSILKVFGLEDRLITSFAEFKDDMVTKPINWGTVNKKWNEFKLEGIEFLKTSLNSY